jgi:hypothetical protein
MFLLLKEEEFDSIDELFARIESAKPRMPAFLTFLKDLEGAGCIEKMVNPQKRSSRMIRLTEACRREILRVIDKPCGHSQPTNIFESTEKRHP